MTCHILKIYQGKALFLSKFFSLWCFI